MLILRDAAYWDGESDEVRRADITCGHDEIRAVHARGAAPRAADSDVELDLAGRYLLPGLIDGHAHLVWSSGQDPAETVEADGEQLTVLRAAMHAREHLAAGVTTIADLGSNWDIAISVARAIETGVFDGPTVIAAGRTVIMTGGHDPFWGVASDGVDAVVRAVRGQAFRGAGIIKTAATGGVYGRPKGEDVHDGELSYPELAALAGEAHRRGLKVAAHALGTEGIRDAVRAGIDIIEHGVFLDDALVGDMVQRGTYLCPTVAIYRSIADAATTGSAPAYATRKAERVVDAHRTSVAKALEAGIPLVAGTDAGSPGMPHGNLVAELEALVDCGVPVVTALRAATSTAADALGRPELGRVRPGASADLVVTDRNPFEGVDALRAPTTVIRSGQVIRP
ncbi:metal-dependent hydrolase family protein [Solicola gregarius]|uniref:Amidohydrolase family protein n=1 Tax=Solicola gregarius TaxID=2908642 RepID=A0AA46TMJ5_9ACTN|nr:amidohydrolase family protein [Solicola gregarius]UYM07682.1 amidohydrolase family protein [Solicola gregarius]